MATQTPELIGLAQRTLRDLRLRVAGASGGGPDALREAGYAGAPSRFDAFEQFQAAIDNSLNKMATDHKQEAASLFVHQFQRFEDVPILAA